MGLSSESTTTVTTTSANGLGKTVVITGNNGMVTADNTLTDNTVINADGLTTETKTMTFSGRNTAAPMATEIINTSANGLSTAAQISEAGNSTYDITDSVVIGLDGSQTETTTLLNNNGSFSEKDVTTTSANGQSVSLQSARNGSSTFNHFETINTNTGGSVTDTVWDTNSSGTTTDEIITNTSADGLSKTAQVEPDGGGVVEQTLSDTTTLNADGSATLVQSVLNGNGTLRSQEVRATSANGLNITTTYDVNGDETVDETTADNTVLNADGSRTETVTTTYAGGTQKSQSVTTTSANGQTVTMSFNLAGYASLTDNIAIAASGAKTETVDNYNAGNSLVTLTVTTTSADGSNIVVDHFNSSNTLTEVDQTLKEAGDYGSYQWIEADGSGDAFYVCNHMINADGVDRVMLVVYGAQELIDVGANDGDDSTTIYWDPLAVYSPILSRHRKRRLLRRSNVSTAPCWTARPTQLSRKLGCNTHNKRMNMTALAQQYHLVHGVFPEIRHAHQCRVR